VFEVDLEDEEEFITFFDKNYIFFTNHLIAINGIISEKVKKYLEEKTLSYVVNTKFPHVKNSKKSEIFSENKQSKPIDKVQENLKENLKVIDTLVRSGQELKINGDLLLLNRVNSGGSINIEGNLIITQIVEGDIRCSGNFMMLKASAKANIVFHGVEVDNKYLQERLNRVELKNNEIKITPVLKETNWG
jgi:hypothetical protein